MMCSDSCHDSVRLELNAKRTALLLTIKHAVYDFTIKDNPTYCSGSQLFPNRILCEIILLLEQEQAVYG